MSKKQQNLVGMYFYNILPEDIEQATSLGIKELKSGKWALKKYDTSGRTFAHNYSLANESFGEGRWWASSNVKEANVQQTPGKISQVSGDKVTIDTQDAPGVTTKTTLPSSYLMKSPDGKLALNKAAITKMPGKPGNTAPQAGQSVQISNDINDIKKLSGLK